MEPTYKYPAVNVIHTVQDHQATVKKNLAYLGPALSAAPIEIQCIEGKLQNFRRGSTIDRVAEKDNLN